eukprot:SAG11_NODE_6669_length_1270_cov_3.258753_2_plen_59_part_01
MAAQAQMHLHAAGNFEELFRHCEWCRNATGNFCETWVAPRACVRECTHRRVQLGGVVVV